MAGSAVQVRPMSFEEYLALPDRAEYVDGAALMTPAPTYRHQKICQRLTRLLEDAAGDRLDVVTGVGWESAPGARVRVPDLMVLAGPPPGDRVTEPPMVVVEVLSGNRADDLVRKAAEYLQCGAGQYWIVDPRDEAMDVYVKDEGWALMAHLDREHPAATVQVPHDSSGISVELDLAVILAG